MARRTMEVVRCTSVIGAVVLLLGAFLPLLLRYCVATADFSFVQRIHLPDWMKLAIQQTTLRA